MMAIIEISSLELLGGAQAMLGGMVSQGSVHVGDLVLDGVNGASDAVLKIRSELMAEILLRFPQACRQGLLLGKSSPSESLWGRFSVLAPNQSFEADGYAAAQFQR